MANNKSKVFLIIGIVILLLGIPLGIIFLGNRTSFRLGATNTNQPATIRVSGITENGATISWTTASPAQSLVSYGLSAANLTLVQSENAAGTNHQIELTRLLPQSNYYFVIKVGQTVFDDNGKPFSFVTLARALSTPTAALTRTPTRIPTSTTSANPTEKDLLNAIGTNNPLYDLNKDGIVNSFDLLLWRQKQK